MINYMRFIPKYFYNFPLSVFLGIVLLGGCVADKQMVPPYQGRVQRESAIRQTGPKPPVVQHAAETAPPSPQSPETGRLLMADDDLLLPVLTSINERIFAYEQKLEILKGIDTEVVTRPAEKTQIEKVNTCRQKIGDMLTRYNALHQQLLRKDSVSTKQLFTGETLLNLQKRDFAFLESDCGKMVSQEHPERSLLPPNRKFIQQKEQLVSSAYARGDYDATITGYEHLMSGVAGPLSYDLTFAYGQALMKTGSEAKSRKVFKELLGRIRQHDQAQWEFKLMQLIGDLDFALGSYMPAKEQYNEIVRVYQGLGEKNEWAKQQLSALNVADKQSEEVKAYADLLRSYLAYNPDRDGYTVVRKAKSFINKYPYSLVASSADHLITVSRKAADEWYRNLLQQVDQLAAEKRYQEALLLIERVPRLILPVEKQQELAVRSKELSTTEAINRETTQLAQEQQAQENWNTGMTALEAKEYDQAIEAFTRLLGTSYDVKARKRIDEAAGLAAQEDRRRAAELFVRSGRTHDLMSRKKLLLASRQLLQDILIKYPQSDLTEKVKRNLKRIDEEINAIDPTLLAAPVTVNGQLPEPVESSTGGPLWKDGRESGVPPAQAVKSQAVTE
jgi:tetratricopeptide (TPR) repeat protein